MSIADDAGGRLATRTLELVDIPSVSRDEAAVLEAIRSQLPRAFEVVDHDDDALFAAPLARRVGAPFVLLAGHVDTVPVGGSVLPGSRQGDAIVGRGGADMKGALAVMLELADDLDRQPDGSDQGEYAHPRAPQEGYALIAQARPATGHLNL